MRIEDAVVLVTGANRGLGLAYAEMAKRRGARKVYACARNPDQITLSGATALKLDVTKAEDVHRAVEIAGDVTIVINNAGILVPGGVSLLADTNGLRQQLETNMFGPLGLSQAFAPILKANGGGAIVNMLSALSWVSAAPLDGYCVSKAAAWMLTNALRSELRGQGTLVVGVHAGFIDTDMAAGAGGEKSSPESVARQVFDALESDQEEVLADEVARKVKSALSSGIYLQGVELG